MYTGIDEEKQPRMAVGWGAVVSCRGVARRAVVQRR